MTGSGERGSEKEYLSLKFMIPGFWEVRGFWQVFFRVVCENDY